VRREEETFMHWVQLHERSWGNDSYRDRPALQQILTSPIVAFWYPVDYRRDERFTCTLHQTVGEIEAYFLNLLIHTTKPPPKRRLYRLYMTGRQIGLKRVQVHLGFTKSGENK
jgi:hypothetical protein